MSKHVHNTKILFTVIISAAIDMVNYLIGFEFSFNFFLGYIPMLKLHKFREDHIARVIDVSFSKP